MSNPFYMYDIFARLNTIESSVKPQPEVLNESAEPAVEPTNRLDEKYQGWKKTVASIKKGGSADNPEAVAAAIGRKKYGKEKFQKAAAAGKKLGETAKPDFLDLDKDGDKKEPMKKAAKEKKLEESMCSECGMYESKCGCDKEQLEEYFYFDEPKKKDRGPRDRGHDELERRNKLGKNPLVKHGKEYKNKGDNYKIAGPKGPLPESEIDESGLQAYLGKKKYGKAGMAALQQAGRDGAGKEKMAKIRAKYDKMDEADVGEGNAFSGAVVKAKRDGIQKGEKITVGGKEYPLKEKLSPGEQKAFAALAEPKDKVTYADKIAGALKKKKVKEAEKTPSGRHEVERTDKGTKYTKVYKDDDDSDDDEDKKSSSDEKRRGRPKKHTDDKPRQERMTAKSRKKDRTAHGQSGFKSSKKKPVDEMGYGGLNYESHMNGPDHGEYDQEGDMAKDQLHTIVKAAKELHSILGDEQNLPEWVQTKITRALDYINTSRDYMDQEESDFDDEMLDEKAVSKQQQKFMGMVHAMQKGGKVKGASPELKKVAKTMKKSDAEDFAATKHKGLPKRVKGGKPVGEDGGPGGIEAEKPYRDPKSGKMITPPRGATNPPQDPVSPAKPPKAPSTKRADADTTSDEQVAETDKNPTDSASKKSKSTGGMTFGKGIYDSMNRDLESMIAENMNVSVNASTDGQKNISVNASEEDADELARLLMMAGIGGQSDGYSEVCGSCGSASCECGDDHVEEAATENNPDYPENMSQGQDTEFMTQTIAGGLNRRKPDITTLPSTMVRNMDESIEHRLWNIYNNSKVQ